MDRGHGTTHHEACIQDMKVHNFKKHIHENDVKYEIENKCSACRKHLPKPWKERELEDAYKKAHEKMNKYHNFPNRVHFRVVKKEFDNAEARI